MFYGSLFTGLFGAYLGVIYQSKYSNGREFYDELSWIGTLRLIYLGILFYIWALPYNYLTGIDDVRIRTLTQAVLPSLGFGFSAFGLIDYFYAENVSSQRQKNRSSSSSNQIMIITI